MHPPHVDVASPMITRDTFPLRRIWPKTYKRLLVLLAFDCAVAVLYTFFGWQWLSIEALPLAQLGSALTIFLAFRANGGSAGIREKNSRIGSNTMIQRGNTPRRQAVRGLQN